MTGNYGVSTIVGLSFGEASRGLKELVEANLNYANRKSKKRWMFCWNEKKRSLVLKEFDRAREIATISSFFIN